MNRELYHQFLTSFAGVLLHAEMTDETLYARYAAFCRNGGHTPDPYDTVYPAIAQTIRTLGAMWYTDTQAFLVQTILFEEDLNTPDLDPVSSDFISLAKIEGGYAVTA